MIIVEIVNISSTSVWYKLGEAYEVKQNNDPRFYYLTEDCSEVEAYYSIIGIITNEKHTKRIINKSDCRIIFNDEF